MDPKLSPGLCIATKCSIVDPTGPLFYMSAKIFLGSVQMQNIELELEQEYRADGNGV